MYGYNIKMSSQAKEDIIKEFLPVVRYTAYRLSWRLPPQISVEDLISVGLNGLFEALERFEQGKVKLKTYAQYRIKGAMLDELRSLDWIPRSRKKKITALKEAHSKLEKELKRDPEDEEVAEALQITLDQYYQLRNESSGGVTLKFEDYDTISEGHPVNLMENIEDPNEKNPLDILMEMDQKKAIARLIDELPEKNKIVLSLYYWEELTMKEVGAVMGLTESRVCQLHNQALVRLKAKINKESDPVPNQTEAPGLKSASKGATLRVGPTDKHIGLNDFFLPRSRMDGVQTMDINGIKKIDFTLKVKSIKPDPSFSEKRKKSKSREKEEKKKNQIDMRV